jgi:ectoine hydroxylase-related dioxygenase (phytanoyl-CoA dioxygenase family)
MLRSMSGVTAHTSLPTSSLDDTAGMAEALRTDGLVLIPGVLDPDEIGALREATDRCRPFGLDGSTATIDHYKCVFNREPLWLSYADRPGVIELAERVMGDDCHLIGMTAWRCRPGYESGQVHADKLFLTLPEDVLADPAIELPIEICTAHYYLNDMDEELCPTWVLPGSHRSGRLPGKDEREWRGRRLEPVLCQAGDVLFFRSEVWHSGSSNVTADRTRYLLQVHYSHRDIAQKFSPFPFQLNPEILAVANERQLRLLGRHRESAYG